MIISTTITYIQKCFQVISLNVWQRNRPFYILRSTVTFLCLAKILIYPLAATPLLLLTLPGTSSLKTILLPSLTTPPPSSLSSPCNCIFLQISPLASSLPCYAFLFLFHFILHHSTSSSSFFPIIPYPPPLFSSSFHITLLLFPHHSCAAKAIFYCPSMNSHRPRSQNIPKESTLNPEKDSTIKRPRSHVSLEKSSQNYKLLENWAKPNLPPDVTPQPANSFGECIWRVCHVVKPGPRTGERAGWIAVWSSSLTGW